MAKKKKARTLLEKIKTNESLTSQILGGVVVLVIGILLFNYFKGISDEVIAPNGATPEVDGDEIVLTEENGGMVPENLPRQYLVQANDSLWKIAENNYGSGYNWVDIAEENGVITTDLITVGQELTLPRVTVREPLNAIKEDVPQELSLPGSEYTIQKGDNLWRIAVRAYGDGYRWVEIAEANDLANPDLIHSGNILNLPR